MSCSRILFADRCNWNLTPNDLSRLQKAKKIAGARIFDLTVSNPTQVGFDYDPEEILSAMSQPQSMVYEPDPHGLPCARQSVARYYSDQGKSIDIESIFLTASTSEAYTFLFKLLANPGDEILIPQPGYPLLSYLSGLESLQHIFYPLRYVEADGWHVDLELLEALINPKTRAIVVVSPNNPTGSCLKAHELTAIDDLCCRHGLALIVDEVFSDFVNGKDANRVKTAVNQTKCLSFVLSGFSKILALPQVKLGWIVVGGNPEICSEARDRLEMITDLYLSVSTTVQHAVERLLALRKPIQRQLLSRIDSNSRFLEAQLTCNENARMLMREGGWYAVIEITDWLSDEERALQLLEKDNIFVHPGYFYEFHKNGFLVVSLITPVDTFQTGISRMSIRLNHMS